MISPETLRFYSLFASQNAEMLKQIAMLANEKFVQAGHPIFFEGEVAKTLYLVLEGAVILTMHMGEKGDQKVEELEPLGKGEVIGWSSIVKPHIYKMGAHTSQESRLIAFDGERLRSLFDENPGFGYYFMREIAKVIGDRLISKCVQIMSMTT
jgi:CRP/FNR family cyclic AMP-dependent transcriptional regulator